jgi:hypothetical protein
MSTSPLLASEGGSTGTGLAGVTYQHTQLGSECIMVEIPTFEEMFSPSDPEHPFFTYHNKPFSKTRYKYGTPLPLHVGQFTIDKSAHVVNVLRVPVKAAGSNTIVLPKELEFIQKYVEFCCLYEKSFNPNFENLFAHITVDKKTVNPEETQRVPGFHVDGFQGSKFPTKHEIEHSYLWTSDCGTEFCSQPYFIEHLDESKFMIFDEFNKQAHECNVFKCLPNNIYIFDPYMVHRSPVVKTTTERLLIRITFEYQKLLDPNDTVNPNLVFKKPLKMDVRNRLGKPEYPPDLRHYGFENK